jgi:hypothetical protein
VRVGGGKPVTIDSMGGVKLQLANANWVESKTVSGKAKVDLVSTLGDVLLWESEKRVEQQKAKDEEQAHEDDLTDTDSDDGDEIWSKDFELDDYFSMDNLASSKEIRPFGDAMKVIAEVFGEILAQLSMTTAGQDTRCDLMEDYQINFLLKTVILDRHDDPSKLAWPVVKRTEKNFITTFFEKVHEAQMVPSQVPYYSEAPVIGPAPENFHGDSILLDSNAKLWFAGDTGKFIERGHVLSAICKFEVLLILDYLKLPVTIDDINSATGANQIAEWLTVSRDVALAIINTRERGGKFTSIADLFSRASAAGTAAVKAKINVQLVSPEERDKHLKEAAKVRGGGMIWSTTRNLTMLTPRPPSHLPPTVHVRDSVLARPAQDGPIQGRVLPAHGVRVGPRDAPEAQAPPVLKDQDVRKFLVKLEVLP